MSDSVKLVPVYDVVPPQVSQAIQSLASACHEWQPSAWMVPPDLPAKSPSNAEEHSTCVYVTSPSPWHGAENELLASFISGAIVGVFLYLIIAKVVIPLLFAGGRLVLRSFQRVKSEASNG